MPSFGSDRSPVVADEKSNETIEERIEGLRKTIHSIQFGTNYAQSQLKMALLYLLEVLEGTSTKNNEKFNELVDQSLIIANDFKTHLNPPQGVLGIDQGVLIDKLNAFQNKSLHFSYFSKLPHAINQVVVAGCGVLDVAPPVPKPRYPWLRSTLESIGFILLTALGMVAGGLLGGILFPGGGIGFGMLAGLGFATALAVNFLGLSNLWLGRKKGKILGALAVFFSSAGIGAGLGALLGTVAFPGIGTTFGALIGAGFGSLSGLLLTGAASLFRGQGQLSRYFGSLSTTLPTAAIGAGAGVLLGHFIFPGAGSLVGLVLGTSAGLITGVTLTAIAAMARGSSRYERFKGFVIASSATTVTGALTGALFAGVLFGVGIIPAMIAGGVVGFATLGVLKIGVDIYRYFTVRNEPINLYATDKQCSETFNHLKQLGSQKKNNSILQMTEKNSIEASVEDGEQITDTTNSTPIVDRSATENEQNDVKLSIK